MTSHIHNNGSHNKDGQLWARMNAQPRRNAGQLCAFEVPDTPGIYALYHCDKPVYVGKGNRLTRRLAQHLSQGSCMTNSALRRNVAEHLGISHPALIKSRLYEPTEEELARVRGFIEECQFAWVTCNSAGEALILERAIKSEWRPPLTKL